MIFSKLWPIVKPLEKSKRRSVFPVSRIPFSWFPINNGNNLILLSPWMVINFTNKNVPPIKIIVGKSRLMAVESRGKVPSKVWIQCFAEPFRNMVYLARPELPGGGYIWGINSFCALFGESLWNRLQCNNDMFSNSFMTKYCISGTRALTSSRLSVAILSVLCKQAGLFVAMLSVVVAVISFTLTPFHKRYAGYRN